MVSHMKFLKIPIITNIVIQYVQQKLMQIIKKRNVMIVILVAYIVQEEQITNV